MELVTIESDLNAKKRLTNFISQECDFLLNIAPTYSYNTLVDFSHRIVNIELSYLIPKANTSMNIAACFRPFQKEVC